MMARVSGDGLEDAKDERPSEDMEYTMQNRFASSVACAISEPAPVVTLSNPSVSSSATRPPIATSI